MIDIIKNTPIKISYIISKKLKKKKNDYVYAARI